MDEIAAPWKASILGRHPVATAAAVAALMALPGLFMPLLADDWGHLAAVARGDFFATPFGYSRPLYAATFWLDRQLWDLSGPLFHLMNIVLIAVAAALVARLALRYGVEPEAGGLAGVLFAIHPMHVESAAWVAARADPLFSVLLLPAAIAWEGWRERPRGVPWMSTALFALALLAKETAIILPAFLILADLCRAGRRRDFPATLRGLGPMAALGLGYFLLVWPRAHGHSPLEMIAKRFGPRLANFAVTSAAAVLPFDAELVGHHVILWTLLAAGTMALIAGLAFVRSGGLPVIAWASLATFVLLIAPSSGVLQDRYLFLPSAALCVGIAALLHRAGSSGRMVALMIVVVWMLFAGQRWADWLEGSRTSPRLIAALAAECADPGTERIVVANMPHRIHGTPVVTDFRAAVTLLGGRSIPIDAIALVDYPDGSVEALAGSEEQAVVRSPAATDIVLRIVPGPYSGVVWPGPGRPPGPESARGTVTTETADRVRIRLIPGPGTAGYYWSRGRLHRVF